MKLFTARPGSIPGRRTASVSALALAVGLGVAVAGWGGLPSLAQTPPPAAAPAPDTVVAKVNGQEIKNADVLAMISSLPPQYQQMPMEMVYPAILDQLISVKLLAAAGYEQKLQDTAEVKERVRRAEERAVQEAYLNRRIDERVTEPMLRERYTSWLAENPGQDEVRARHILVASEAEAKQIIEQLGRGGDFAQIAQQRSTDRGSAAQGGDLGFFGAADMVQPFSDAAFTITPGQVGRAPVQTQFGWHVIKVEERRESQPRSFEEVRDELRSELQSQVIGGILEELRAGARVERFNPDGTPMVR